MLPSQEEPALDPGGLWYAGGKGVMNVGSVIWNPGMSVERIREVMKSVMKMLPSQEDPALDPGGLWYGGGKGVMNVESGM